MDETGRHVYLNLAERNVLIGGESGGGKSVALQLLVAHGALADDSSLILFDGKLVELGLWRDCAERFVDHKSIDDAITTNRWLQDKISERAEWLLDIKKRKITPDMGLRFYLVVTDEYAYFSTVIKGTKAQRSEFEDTSRDIAARGRFVGIIPLLATQRPSHQVIDPSLRDLFGYRWAFRCSTSASSSDRILGPGLGHRWMGRLRRIPHQPKGTRRVPAARRRRQTPPHQNRLPVRRPDRHPRRPRAPRLPPRPRKEPQHDHSQRLRRRGWPGTPGPADSQNTVNDRLTPKRARPVVENDAYAAFARRILAAYARRIADGDIEALTLMTGLADDIEAAIRNAITGLREFGYSWADIGNRLGVTRQAAQQRWGNQL